MQNEERIECMASGLTKDTTAVAGSTLVTPAVESTVTRIVSPLAGEIDSTRAGRSRSGRGSSF
ncbi:hypothetical protein GCM10023065_01120 [Microbacterium laevaniformans]|uniref:Uncharacterized protein n=1 Tax=Microbacterium dextranolyticum TaxID=36806 RepID=A0A9W6HPL3_9MICO|nr:hypothetical protein GCM10017578_28270 [Microbacterium laevaniformans]GLJ96672.1 hypothetical protein GCM10017591_27350 [Microbacterium dextranolyticum]